MAYIVPLIYPHNFYRILKLQFPYRTDILYPPFIIAFVIVSLGYVLYPLKFNLLKILIFHTTDRKAILLKPNVWCNCFIRLY